MAVAETVCGYNCGTRVLRHESLLAVGWSEGTVGIELTPSLIKRIAHSERSRNKWTECRHNTRLNSTKRSASEKRAEPRTKLNLS